MGFSRCVLLCVKMPAENLPKNERKTTTTAFPGRQQTGRQLGDARVGREIGSCTSEDARQCVYLRFGGVLVGVFFFFWGAADP